MSFVVFVLGLLAGSAAVAVLLVPRLRAAVDDARLAREGGRAAVLGSSRSCRAVVSSSPSR